MLWRQRDIGMSEEDCIYLYFILDDANISGPHWFGARSEQDARELGGGTRYGMSRVKLHKSHVGYCAYHDSGPWRGRLFVMYDCNHECNGKGKHDFQCCECEFYKPLATRGDNAIKRF